MTSRLQDIVAEFVTELADANVTVAIGRKELHRNNAPPRVVFERVGGEVVMTQEIGRQDITTEATRQLWTRNLKLVMHCWGQDEEQAEQLMHNAAVAMRRAVGSGNIILGEESWGNEAADGDVNLGEEVTLEVGLQIPILDQMLDLRAQPIVFVRLAEFASTSGACG
jgi:hypothetical protein